MLPTAQHAYIVSKISYVKRRFSSLFIFFFLQTTIWARAKSLESRRICLSTLPTNQSIHSFWRWAYSLVFLSARNEASWCRCSEGIGWRLKEKQQEDEP